MDEVENTELKGDEKILSDAKKRFELCEDAWSDNFKEALDDIKFARLGEQWPAEIKRQRELESRPCLTINRLPAFIRQVVNDARLNSPSIKVLPQDSQSDPETADVVNGLIRNIEASSNAEGAYDNALDDAVTCGFGYFRIGYDYARDDAFDMDLGIERIANPLSVYFDPNSEEVDASDWQYCFVIQEMSKSEFKQAYPNAKTSNWGDVDPKGWVTEDTVRVAEYWTRDEVDTQLLMLDNGIVTNQENYENNPVLQQFQIVQQRPTKTFKVTQRIITSAEVLEETDWPGRYIPICPVLGDEINVEGKRYFYSLVRPAKDTQRNFNYWRTAATEKVALATKAPWIGPKGSFDSDARKWETANVESHPFIEYDPVGTVPPTQTMPSMVDAGSMQEAMNASDDLKAIIGIYDASLGARSNETSGRAIMARQHEGDVSTFHYIDNLSRGIRYAGRVLLDLIPHVYNTPRVIRTLGYDETPNNVKINELDETTNKLHDLTKGKYDLVVETGPSFSTKREEAATQMTELIRSFPDAAPIIGDLVAKNLDWPGADEIAKRLKVLLPPEIQALEDKEGLPEEAAAIAAQAEAQITQLTQIIEQGKQMLAEKDEAIAKLEIAAKSKSEENQVKVLDIEKRHEAAMTKIQADLEIAGAKLQEDFTKEMQKIQVDALRQRVDAIGVASGVPIDTDPRVKTISIRAPSGDVYEGVINESTPIEESDTGTDGIQTN